MSEIIEKADELGELVKKDDRAIEFVNAQNAFNEDKALQGLISEFNLHRMALQNESRSDSPDNEKLAQLEARVSGVYETVMKQDTMVKYNNAKNSVDELLNEINSVLVYHITGEKPGCDTSNCSSCGGGCQH